MKAIREYVRPELVDCVVDALGLNGSGGDGNDTGACPSPYRPGER